MIRTSRNSHGCKKCHTPAKSSPGCGDPDIIEGVIAAKTGFYQRAAEKTKNPVGKRMFLSMIEDEKKQVDDFRCIAEIRGIRIRDVARPMNKIRTLFEKTGEILLGRIKRTTDEVDALKIAMEMEREGIELCERLSEKTQSRKVKALVERLIKAERQRYAIFSNTHLFLSDSGSWFMWDEHSIMDGGTPWA
ncbi:MAG TPA: ferritin family protein [Thermodesulfovibrionales bacterium]|nr:ferritin family protein [Thermodesulfovibrionales bacterium]